MELCTVHLLPAGPHRRHRQQLGRAVKGQRARRRRRRVAHRGLQQWCEEDAGGSAEGRRLCRRRPPTDWRRRRKGPSEAAAAEPRTCCCSPERACRRPDLITQAAGSCPGALAERAGAHRTFGARDCWAALDRAARGSGAICTGCALGSRAAALGAAGRPPRRAGAGRAVVQRSLLRVVCDPQAARGRKRVAAAAQHAGRASPPALASRLDGIPGALHSVEAHSMAMRR